MRKIASFVAVGLLALSTAAAFAAMPTNVMNVESDLTPSENGDYRGNVCGPNPIIFDSGMFDEFTPPVGCATAASAQCFVQAANPGTVADWRLGGDEFITNGETVTHAKFWARYNASGYDSGIRPYGFIVRIHEAVDPIYCPDGSLPGDDAIGPLVYDNYVSVFTEEEIFTGLIRNFSYCLTLPVPFPTEAGKNYWFTMCPDYELVDWNGLGEANTQIFWRMNEPLGFSACEAAARYYDDTNLIYDEWTDVSTLVAQPCWEGWDASLILYGEPGVGVTGACCYESECLVVAPNECFGQYQGDGTTCDPNPCITPTEATSWGGVKARFAN
jgi:hypothetical protein